MSWDDGCVQVAPVLVPIELPYMYGVGGPSLIYPCLPKRKSQMHYCCGQELESTRRRSRSRRRSPDCHKHCKSYHDDTRLNSPRRHYCRNDTEDRAPPHRSQGPHSCQSCCETSKPVKTKYVMPCYRYEDGQIEQYVPNVYGRLPTTAYKRNGMQDQLYGYRGAVRYLCVPHTYCSTEGSVHTAVEPLKTVFPKITQEVSAVKKKKEKCKPSCR